jgi:hypothetical protein
MCAEVKRLWYREHEFSSCPVAGLQLEIAQLLGDASEPFKLVAPLKRVSDAARIIGLALPAPRCSFRYDRRVRAMLLDQPFTGVAQLQASNGGHGEIEVEQANN